MQKLNSNILLAKTLTRAENNASTKLITFLLLTELLIKGVLKWLLEAGNCAYVHYSLH